MPCPLTTTLPTTVSPLQYQHVEISDYMRMCNNTVMSISQQVTEILSEEEGECAPVEVDDWVLRKVARFSWTDPR